jgi:hypothetical protein
MSRASIDDLFIVGAGFSHYAGLPLTNGFTEALLEPMDSSVGIHRLLTEFMKTFVYESFGHGRNTRGKTWPDLEDLFTFVDLSANSGHHLGCGFSPADLRTVRRAMLSLIIRMLDNKYRTGRKKAKEWWKLEEMFASIHPSRVGFISMNWDTVIERKLAAICGNPFIDYCCDAVPLGYRNGRTMNTKFTSRGRWC